MKKNNTLERSQSQLTKTTRRQIQKQASQQRLTIGLDLGDRVSHYCILDEQGGILLQDKLATTKTGLNRLFEKLATTRVVLEVGTHSPWTSRHLAGLGQEVIVANPRNVAWIKESRRKNDRLDAEKLARLGRMDPKLLSPIRHRGEEAQRDLAEIRTRAVLVEARTAVVNSARGQAKSFGGRLESCDCAQAGPELAASLPENLQSFVKPLLETAAHLTAQIQAADRRIHEIAKRYPEIELLTAIWGVGELTALAFMLTIEDQQRFSQSRQVGPYLGLVPGQSQSGERDPQQRITKEGDRLMRWLLVQCAHCILKQGAPDSDLRRWGLAKIEQQKKKQPPGPVGKPAKGKKKVVVAVARKLAVLMHRLWAGGEVYDPLYGAKQQAAQAHRAAA